MPINHNIDDQSRLLVTTCIGEAVEEELIEALINYQATIQNHPDYIDYNEIVIFPEETNIKLTAAGVKRLAQIAAKSDVHDLNRKLALLVNSKLGHNLAKMYQVYRNLGKRSGKKVRVFKNVKDAFEWARVKQSKI